jgi:VanZ family protein
MHVKDERSILPQTYARPEADRGSVRPAWLWMVWGLFLAAWTVALLTTFPVRVQESLIPPEGHFVSSKGLHVGAYAFLTGLIGWLPVRGRWRWLLVAVLSLHGCATEYLQQFVEGRTGCWEDVGIDHIGIVLGLLLTYRWWAEKT